MAHASAQDIILLDEQMLNESTREKLASLQGPVIELVGQNKQSEPPESCFAASVYKPVHRRALYAAIENALLQEEESDAVNLEEPSSAPEQQALVLLVEDNLTNQIVAKGILGLFGLTVEVAENGEVALAMLKETTYNLIFMDCQMPVMDGYEATRAIRELDPSSATPKGVPVIALSANAMKGDDQLCFDAGMDDHVAKPISKDRLGEVIELWLGKKHS
ncbi:Aerobic respiration control sensor protein ArcB [Marinomonas aquimarina]|uniref:Aerobic respiration control sensor protein ArcB n=2 Tax=Marinomonas aquimarina TaxID=295068 RepID=A0A1A8TKJ7_9GAMM|nr:Aerobic respiration control sensor protein ArcB [Marinomonas aquimarina]